MLGKINTDPEVVLSTDIFCRDTEGHHCMHSLCACSQVRDISPCALPDWKDGDHSLIESIWKTDDLKVLHQSDGCQRTVKQMHLKLL